MFTVLHYDTIGSTNDEAKRLAAEGAAHGVVVHADEQTAGRGRLARRWVSPPGNLYMSVLLRLNIAPARLAELSFLTALALAEALDALLPKHIRATLKWPNDVLAQGGKIAGILLEHQEGAIIIGTGVNVLHAPATGQYQTACIVASGGMASVDTARDILLKRLEAHLKLWLADGFEPIRTGWLERAHRLGDELRVAVGEQKVEGTFAGLDVDGALLLDTLDGRRRVVAGDVAIV
jgi:BirA family biotin operon repressor/biotin-[acetyl-CoA-carboxylase] ligase